VSGLSHVRFELRKQELKPDTVMSGLTYSHLDVRFEHRDRSSNRRVLKPDMTVSGLSSCPASMSGLRTKLVKYSTNPSTTS